MAFALDLHLGAAQSEGDVDLDEPKQLPCYQLCFPWCHSLLRAAYVSSRVIRSLLNMEAELS